MKNKKGFTLIELILVIILIGIISGFVGGMLFQETKFFTLATSRKEINLEKKLFFERVYKELRDAYKNEYTTGSNVRFKIPFSVYKNYTSIRLFLSGNKLYLSTNNSSPLLISDKVIFFNITSLRWQPDRDLIKIKAVHKVNNETASLETSIFLRNSR